MNLHESQRGCICLFEPQNPPIKSTLPETNSSPLKMDGWKLEDKFPGARYLQGRTIHFRDGLCHFYTADDVASHLFFVEGGILPSWAPKRLRGDQMDGYTYLRGNKPRYPHISIFTFGIWYDMTFVFLGKDHKIIKGVCIIIHFWSIQFLPPEKIQQNNMGPPCSLMRILGKVLAELNATPRETFPDPVGC